MPERRQLKHPFCYTAARISVAKSLSDADTGGAFNIRKQTHTIMQLEVHRNQESGLNRTQIETVESKPFQQRAEGSRVEPEKILSAETIFFWALNRKNALKKLGLVTA